MLIFEKVFSIVSYYIAFYLEYVNLCNITKEKHKFRLYNTLIIGIIAGINYILALSGVVILKMIVSYLSILIIAKIMVKLDIKKSLVSSIIYYIMIIMIEYASTFIIIDLLKYNPNKFLLSVSVQNCIIGHIINAVTYLICRLKCINKMFNLICNVIYKLGIKNKHIYYFLIGIIVIEMMYITNVIGKIDIIYALLYIFFFIIFIVYTVMSLYKNYYLKELNLFLIDKDKDMQKLINEYRIFQHNVRNNLLAISSISDNNVKEMIQEYLDSYNIGTETTNNIGSMPEGLKGVLYQKLINNNKLSTSIIVDNFIKNDPINVLSIKEYRKLIVSLGIIIDNSLEAISSYSEDFIYMYLYETTDLYIIRCVNPFKSDIDIDSLTKEGSTSKKGHTGLGLYYIKNKTKFDYKCRIINNKFYSELRIEK